MSRDAGVESRRGLIFALALIVLAAGALLVSVLSGGSEGGAEGESVTRTAAPPQDQRHREESRGAEAAARGFAERLKGRATAQLRRAENESYGVPVATEVGRAVERFVRVYLRYGEARSADRAALRRSATPRLADELLSAPVRVPPGLRVPAERFLRVGVVRPAVFGRALGFSVAAVIERDGRPRVLGVSVIEHLGRWMVAEVGR